MFGYHVREIIHISFLFLLRVSTLIVSFQFPRFAYDIGTLLAVIVLQFLAKDDSYTVFLDALFRRIPRP